MTNDFAPKPEEPLLIHELETVGIITDKIYSHCKYREYLPELEINIGDEIFESIRFRAGFIVDKTLIVNEIPDRPNFKRARFTLRIPCEITTSSGKVVEEFLPDIYKDIVLFIPPARDEFNLRIVVETESKILNEPVQVDENIIFSIGVFGTVQVVGRVQLLIPAYGFVPEPPTEENFLQEVDNLSVRFNEEPFPSFFPANFDELLNEDE